MRTLFIFLLFLVLPTGSVMAQEDTVLKTLYSKRFSMGTDGIPRVRVGIHTGLASVKIFAPTGLQVSSGKGPGITVTGPSTYKVTATKTTPARLRYYISLKSVPAARTDLFTAAQKAFARAKIKTTIKEQGFIISLRGKVLDTRRFLFSLGPFSSRARAAVRLKKEAKKHLGAFIHTELVSLPQGTLSASGRGVFVTGVSVITFTSASGGGISVDAGKNPLVYPDIIHVVIGRDGKLTVVNELSMETYLAGILPSELFPSAPMESLKAQAVAARGQVLAKMGTRHHGDPFHLCSRVHCQVYEGLHKVYARTTKAVKETRGMVLFDAQGLPADTVYHSSSGGHGEHNENVWGGEPKPYLRGRPDGISWHYTTDADLSGFLLKPPVSFCKAGNKGFRWVVTLAPSATATLLKKAGIPGRIKSVRVTRRGVSGRALELRLTTSKKKVTISGELNIRRLFGGLRSSLFLVSQKGQSLVFTGAGYGHGVGMSQWGAINRAKAGQSFTKILRHYYFGTKLIKLF